MNHVNTEAREATTISPVSSTNLALRGASHLIFSTQNISTIYTEQTKTILENRFDFEVRWPSGYGASFRTAWSFCLSGTLLVGNSQSKSMSNKQTRVKLTVRSRVGSNPTLIRMFSRTLFSFWTFEMGVKRRAFCRWLRQRPAIDVANPRPHQPGNGRHFCCTSVVACRSIEHIAGCLRGTSIC